MSTTLRTLRGHHRPLKGLLTCDPLLSHQQPTRNSLNASFPSRLPGSAQNHSGSQESDAKPSVDQGAPHQASWDFSRIPVYPDEPVQRSLPRIELGTVHFDGFSSQKEAGVARRTDGSPDELDVMQEDQDGLIPSVFERRRTGHGVNIRVNGGSPSGTPDYPDGIRWVQTVETNTPLSGRGSLYVDFVPPSDDGKPFYFTDARENATFSDNPSRSANGVQWNAILSLVGVRERTITRFDSVKYGFDIDPSGTLSLHRSEERRVGKDGR